MNGTLTYAHAQDHNLDLQRAAARSRRRPRIVRAGKPERHLFSGQRRLRHAIAG
jgi:hypothetical protein